MTKRELAVLSATSLLVLGVLITSVAVWTSRRPAWVLSAKNADDGVVVSVYKENENAATYSTVLRGHSILREMERVKRGDLPPEIGTTTFYDETIRPGRWTVILDGVELDIMEARMIHGGSHELKPRE